MIHLGRRTFLGAFGVASAGLLGLLPGVAGCSKKDEAAVEQAIDEWFPGLKDLELGTDHLAWGPKDTRYDTLSTDRIVRKLDASGKELWSYSDKLDYPSNVISLPDGRLYILDKGRDVVVELDPDGKAIRTFGGNGSDPGQLSGARAGALDKEGTLWVADTFNNAIQGFEQGGKTGLRFGAFGDASKADALNAPRGLAVAPDGLLHVLDSGNARVQVFDRTGVWKRSYATASVGETGQIVVGRSISIATSGHAFVSDSVAGKVDLYDPAGKLLAQFGGLQFDNLNCAPLDISTTQTDRRIYVRVRVWVT